MKLPAKIIEKLVMESGLIEPDDFASALADAKSLSRPVEDVLVAKGLIPDDYLGQLIAEGLNCKYINLESMEIPDHVLRLIPERVARHKQAIAFDLNPSYGLKIAMDDPTDLEFVRNMEKKVGVRATAYLATKKGLQFGYESYTKDLESAIHSIEEKYDALVGGRSDSSGHADESRIVSILDLVMDYAYQNNASDVHIEPREENIVIRYRIDGILHDVAFLPRDYLAPMVTRIKILSRLRTDEHLAAQDGKFQETIDSQRIDVRVSILPIVDGEKVVMRLLAEKGKTFDMSDLGLDAEGMKILRRHSHKSFGMILSTGPTGSGKTTSLYAILRELNSRDVNIATIEDPIEYAMEGANQIQVNQKTGLTFASGLRSIVRQDPDIVMVGEIRDPETASIAINAAMTGHLVLSTLHTNDAATTLPRFREMGVEPFLVSSTINLIVAQRLVRKICPRCIMSVVMPLDELRELISEKSIKQFFYADGNENKTEINLFRGKGCDSCNHSGYHGRVGIFELLEMDESIRHLVMDNANSKAIQQKAIENGMVTMFEDGIKKVIKGMTTIDEVLRVTAEV
jgi:type IV pilus assembly protein PilB